MSVHTRNALLPAFTLIGVVSPLGAIADVTVQEQTTVNVSTVKAHGLATYRISGDKERSETELWCDGPMSSACGKGSHVDIVRLDRGVTWTVVPKNKQYTETPFSTSPERRTAGESLQGAPQSCPVPRQAPAIDISKCELTPPKLTVDKTDETATLAGHDAQRTNLKLTQHCNSQDPGQACELTYSFDVWLTLDQLPGRDDHSAFRRHYVASAVGDSSAVILAPLGSYLAPYATAMQQLSGKSNELAGDPLKTTFRVGFSGTSCGAVATSTPSAAAGAFSGATTAAKVATASSAEHAAGWGTADAVTRSTGSGVGGYVAGSAAGAFTGQLISGFFAKKPKPDAKPAAAPVAAGAPTTILAEVTTETTSLSAEPIPAAQFELPPGSTRIVANPNGEPQSCRPRKDRFEIHQ